MSQNVKWSPCLIGELSAIQNLNSLWSLMLQLLYPNLKYHNSPLKYPQGCTLVDGSPKVVERPKLQLSQSH